MEYDIQYKQVIARILEENNNVDDRTGVGTKSTFDVNFNIDLRHEHPYERLLPALTLRKVFPRVAFEELKWMLSGSTDARILQENNIRIWDGNSSREYLDSVGLESVREGFIGKGYGYQMRNFNGVDQLVKVIRGISRDPNSRRHVISFWNPADLDEMALAPCHLLYNFVVTGEYLNLKFYQRSGDLVLGIPMNVMWSTFFLTFVADLLGFKVGSLAHSIGDCHIYNNHLEVAKELLGVEPMTDMATFEWEISDYKNRYFHGDEWDLLDWDKVDVKYDSHPAIAREKLIMAV